MSVFEADILGISCAGCNGACCTNKAIELTPPEAVQLRTAGTHLADPTDTTHLPKPLRGRQIYLMLGRCGNLGADETCQDYGNRPAVCRELSVGSMVCQDMRQAEVVLGNLVALPQPMLRVNL